MGVDMGIDREKEIRLDEDIEVDIGTNAEKDIDMDTCAGT